MIDKLYEMICKSVPDYQGKICVPISGGLDSRVLAGIIGRRRKIDLAYCQYHVGDDWDDRHMDYATEIQKHCNVDRFVKIGTSPRDVERDEGLIENIPFPEIQRKCGNFTGVRILAEDTGLKEYTMIGGHGLDVMTGIAVNPLTIFGKYKQIDEALLQKMAKNRHILSHVYGHFFKDWDLPFWNYELYDFCLKLPMKYRFNQYLYRKMIQKFFPELAKIPRADMNVPMNIGEVRYFYERCKYSLKKYCRNHSKK